MVKEEKIQEEILRTSLDIALKSIGNISPDEIPSADEFMSAIESDDFWENLLKMDTKAIDTKMMTGGARKRRHIQRKTDGRRKKTDTDIPDEIGSIQRRVLDYLVSVATPIIGIETGASACSVVMSFINVASWSAFIYLMILSPEGISKEISKIVSGPIHYFISQVPTINEGMEEFTMGKIISFVERLYTRHSVDGIPDIVNAVGYVASLVKINGALFEEMILQPVACVISPIIPSCIERCAGKSPIYYTGKKRKTIKKRGNINKKLNKKTKKTLRRRLHT